jgi:hypothetical protein
VFRRRALQLLLQGESLKPYYDDGSPMKISGGARQMIPALELGRSPLGNDYLLQESSFPKAGALEQPFCP